jgi:hypothetical protein
MASPLQTGKQSIDLGASAPRGSRIRRDPPPAVKEIEVRDRDERDTRIVVIGILTFALAFAIIAIGVSNFIGWSPRQYTAHV